MGASILKIPTWKPSSPVGPLAVECAGLYALIAALAAGCSEIGELIGDAPGGAAGLIAGFAFGTLAWDVGARRLLRR